MWGSSLLTYNVGGYHPTTCNVYMFLCSTVTGGDDGQDRLVAHGTDRNH